MQIQAAKELAKPLRKILPDMRKISLGQSGVGAPSWGPSPTVGEQFTDGGLIWEIVPRGTTTPPARIDSTAYGVGNRVEAGDKDARVVESGFGVRLIKTESGESYCREKTVKSWEGSPLLPGESTHRKGLECKIACSVTEGGTSGAGAPSWNGLLPGRRIQDGSLNWEIVAGSTTTSWKASTDYKLGDEIIVGGLGEELLNAQRLRN